MSEPSRTLLITPFFDAALPSGGAFYSTSVTAEWLRRGRRVAVLCADTPGSLGDMQADADAGRLSLHPIVGAEEIRFTHHRHDAVGAEAARLIDEFRPQLIHVHNFQGCMSAVLAAIRSRVPVVLTALDFGLLCFNFYLDDGSEVPCQGPESPESCAACVRRGLHGTGGRLGPLLPRTLSRRIWPRFVRLDQIQSATELHADMRHVLRSAAAIIAPSPIVAERLRAHGAPRDRVVEILYGLSADKIIRPAKTLSESLRFAYLGNAERIKGLQVLIRAAALLPDGVPLEITAMSGAAVRERIEGASAAARRYLRYHPPLFGKALAGAHAGIDAVLVPSLWHENSPFVVLESLANGTPVIASDQAGIAHLIMPEHTGWLIKPGDPAAWARALIEAVLRPARVRRMQINARFARTTVEFVDDMEQVESSLLAGRVRPHAVAAR